MKLDITSTVLEKGIDLAKDFLGKLITPTVEETGLLLKENVTFWKFKHQIAMLNKAREHCIKHNISPKAISLKLLCPLLDSAALEEDDYLQDKWAILLSNMVDSTQNIENHVFPFLLSQISKTEFQVIEKIFQLRQQRTKKLTEELNIYKKENSEKEEFLITKIKAFGDTKNNWELTSKKWDLEKELRDVQKPKFKILNELKEPEYIPNTALQDFELSNLIRLGIAKTIQQNYAYSNSHKIQNDPHAENLYLEDLEIEIIPDGELYAMSELGELFLQACSEKQ